MIYCTVIYISLIKQNYFGLPLRLSEFSLVGLWESRQAGVFGWSLISVQVIIILSSDKIISLEVADFLS